MPALNKPKLMSAANSKQTTKSSKISIKQNPAFLFLKRSSKAKVWHQCFPELQLNTVEMIRKANIKNIRCVT